MYSEGVQNDDLWELQAVLYLGTMTLGDLIRLSVIGRLVKGDKRKQKLILKGMLIIAGY